MNTGYFYPHSKARIQLKDPVIRKDTDFAFINCGGTIVSEPNQNLTGVSPILDLYHRDPLFKKYIDSGVSYHPYKLSLSEFWSLEDYIDLKKYVTTLKEKKIIFTHGTDNISFFGPWIDLLAKELKFKAVILIGQRDWSKPTSEFPELINNSLKVVSKVNSGNAVVITHNNQIRIHNPYELRKIHTTSKEGFYSPFPVRLGQSMSKVYTKFKTTPSTVSKLKDCNKMDIELQNLEQSNCKVDLVIGRGVGGTKSKTHTFFSTIVGSGPVNSILYSGSQKKPALCTREVNFTWQAMYILCKLTNVSRN